MIAVDYPSSLAVANSTSESLNEEPLFQNSNCGSDKRRARRTQKLARLIRSPGQEVSQPLGLTILPCLVNDEPRVGLKICMNNL